MEEMTVVQNYMTNVWTMVLSSTINRGVDVDVAIAAANKAAAAYKSALEDGFAEG